MVGVGVVVVVSVGRLEKEDGILIAMKDEEVLKKVEEEDEGENEEKGENEEEYEEEGDEGLHGYEKE